jgi:2-polyprenyl-3-methyl-5-hydroxy-6-metoxy-1,4-benzoquinol methylase
MTISTERPSANIDELFLKEYSAEEAIRKYTKETAGEGISYLLENDYGKMYLDALENSIPRSAVEDGVRLIEFGCGGGMNLVHLVSTMERKGIALQRAYGTDFSEKLIEAANQEAKTYLSPKQNEKIQFCPARNENLVEDLAKGIGSPKSALLGSFHLILGVNTFRYCQRLKADVECARAIFDLLVEGGICIMIDMNKGFPLFRSRFRDRLTKDEEAYYLPSLEEYARPFSTVGFELLRKENFCWIPHSAGPRLTWFLKALTPALNSMAPNRAMRSLVISRKPGRRLP